MQTYPVIYIGLLQVLLILMGCAFTHRGYGEYVWLLLAVPIFWATLATWLQTSTYSFWSNTLLPYLTGILIPAYLFYFFFYDFFRTIGVGVNRD